MPSAGFEPTIQASERQQTHALDRAATGIGSHLIRCSQFVHILRQLKMFCRRQLRRYDWYNYLLLEEAHDITSQLD